MARGRFVRHAKGHSRQLSHAFHEFIGRVPVQQSSDVTSLLAAANGGDSEALGEIVALLYEQLRLIARRRLRRERDGHTLESAALVNEAFLRLLGVDRVAWRDSQHVVAMTVRMMRRVLVDHAIRRRTLKRGGGDVTVTLDSAISSGGAVLFSQLEARADELHALDDALRRLEELNPRQSSVIECRFFGGLSVEETADALSLSPATVKRDWVAARAWLNRELAE
jgi:RNA polymerase sigma factor (TIGR02999 family)